MSVQAPLPESDEARRVGQPAAAPQRVGFVIGQLHAGGSERQLTELALGLHARGRCLPYVYCLSQFTKPFGPILEKAGIPVRVLPRHHSLELSRALRLARRLREDRIRLVLSFAQIVNLYSYLALRIYRGAVFLTSSRVADLPESGLQRSINGWIYRRSRIVVSNSRLGRESASRIYGIPSSRLEVIPNGILTERFQFAGGQAEARRTLSIPEGPPVVGLVGRLTAQKRVDLFLQAAQIIAARLPETRFLIAGSGELMDDMTRLARESGLTSHLRFLGVREDMPLVFAAMDLLALASDFEGLPNVIMEAMAAGLPVVATDLGGCRELIVEGVTGFLVPPGDSSALAERIVSVLALPDRGRSLGAAGRQRILAEFSMDAMIQRFEELFLRFKNPD